MSKDTDQSKSLIDEIYDEFLRSLKESGELDENLLEKLTPLIKKGKIRKYQQVAKLLKDSVDNEK